MELLDVIGSGNIHRCRGIQPYAATIYGLQTDELKNFSAISKIELTLAVEGTSGNFQGNCFKKFTGQEKS